MGLLFTTHLEYCLDTYFMAASTSRSGLPVLFRCRDPSRENPENGFGVFLRLVYKKNKTRKGIVGKEDVHRRTSLHFMIGSKQLECRGCNLSVLAASG